jgi:hypothetical protein
VLKNKEPLQVVRERASPYNVGTYKSYHNLWEKLSNLIKGPVRERPQGCPKKMLQFVNKHIRLVVDESN